MDVDDRFFAEFARDLQVQAIWDDCRQLAATTSSKAKGKAAMTDSPPPLDSRKLFWEMMAASRILDPHIFPVLRRLRSSGRYVVAALSNTVIFDPSTAYASAAARLAGEFDVYISSAHVGFRKPDPKIFELAVSAIDGFARRSASRAGSTAPRQWADGVRADEVVFLDDIGENCKAGREVGLRTIKVNLGRTIEAVKELEKELGLALGDAMEVSKL
jgi:FMN phosphatase YigB (HAD superfamily)